jgi:hypothetical protein
MILCKLRPATPEIHLAVAIIVYLHLVRSTSTRFFAKDGFMELAPIHELSKLERNTPLLTALSPAITKKENRLTGGGGEALRGEAFASTTW